MFARLFLAWTMSIFCLFRCDCRVVMCLPSSILVSEQPCLVLAFSEITHVQPESTKIQL